MSAGSLFAGWMMHKTGKYRLINLLFGIFPFIAGVSISMLREDSGPIKSWLSIVRFFPLAFFLTKFLKGLRFHSGSEMP